MDSRERRVTALSCLCVHFSSLSLSLPPCGVRCCCVYLYTRSVDLRCRCSTDKKKRAHRHWRCHFYVVFSFVVPLSRVKKGARLVFGFVLSVDAKSSVGPVVASVPRGLFLASQSPRRILHFFSISASLAGRWAIAWYFDPPPRIGRHKERLFSTTNGVRKLQQRKRAVVVSGIDQGARPLPHKAKPAPDPSLRLFFFFLLESIFWRHWIPLFSCKLA